MFDTFELMYMLPTRRPSSSETPSPGSAPCAETWAPVVSPDDPVLPGPVRHCSAYLLDQCGTGRFDRDAGQDRAGRVLDDAGDGPERLTGGRDGQRKEADQKHHGRRNRSHASPPFSNKPPE